MANVERTMENLEKRGYRVSRFPDKETANSYLVAELGDAVVGIGGTMTVKEMGLYPRLAARGTTYWHLERREELDDANMAPVYIMSANGVSESGQIINIDGYGNRVMQMCYGHERLYFIIGINKIAPNDEMAMWRARNIASVKNARRCEKNTPCTPGDDLICYDCEHPERICRVFVTLENPPTSIPHVEVVIIDEALGY